MQARHAPEEAYVYKSLGKIHRLQSHLARDSSKRIRKKKRKKEHTHTFGSFHTLFCAFSAMYTLCIFFLSITLCDVQIYRYEFELFCSWSARGALVISELLESQLVLSKLSRFVVIPLSCFFGFTYILCIYRSTLFRLDREAEKD